MSTSSSINAQLRNDAAQWARDLKIGREIKSRLGEIRFDRIFETWRQFRRGNRHRQIAIEDLPPGMHGITRIRGGQVQSIAISRSDPKHRQELALVHELLHRYFHPSQPNHDQLHTLAAGLAKHIFPRYDAGGDSMPGYLPEELLELEDDEFGAEDVIDMIADEDDVFELEDGYYDEDDDDEEGLDDFAEMLGYGDADNYDLHFFKKLKRSFKRFKKTTAAKVLMPHLLIPKKIRQSFTPHGLIQSAMRKKRHAKKRRKARKQAQAAEALAAQRAKSAGGGLIRTPYSAGPAALATRMAYGGPAMPTMQLFFESGKYVIPGRGIAAAKRITNIAGWKAPSFPAWWNSALQSLEAGTGRTVKDIQSTIITAAATSLTLGAGTRAVALRCRYAFSTDDHDNRRLRVRHFVGGTQELEYQLDLAPKNGVSEWWVMNIENDSGKGIPTAQNALNVTIDAGEGQAGAQFSIESINLRDLQS